jgi:hypothetical protein
MAVAKTPATLDEANNLEDFIPPTEPWPAGAWVMIGGGTTGQPEREIFWSDSAGQFDYGFAPDTSGGNDITEDILGDADDLPNTLTALKTDPNYGDGRLSTVDVNKFTTGKYVQLDTGQAYYDSGQSGTPPVGTGVWQTGASPGEPVEKVTGVQTGTPGKWLPDGVTPPETLTYANALADGSPANGFSKPGVTPWAAGEHVFLKGGVQDVTWDGTDFVDVTP